MKKIIFTSLIGLMTAGNLSAQVEILDEPYTATGVSNEGLVVLSYAWGAPYSMWNPETGDLYEIGGVTAGDGHGGMARFSADGKWVCGAAMSKMDWPEDTWEKTSKHQSDYIINDITYADGQTFYAVGQDTKNNNKGVLMASSDGQIWKNILQGKVVDGMQEGDMLETNAPLNSICFPVDYVGFTCGDGAYFAYSTNKGSGWYGMDPRPATNSTDQVKSYRTLDFIKEPPYAGVVGAELEDGGYTVYQTPDGAESWQATTGVAGIPVHISHSGSIFWMVTKNGHIQKSIDNGLTWTDVFTTDEPLYKIRFSSDNRTGIALSEGIVYRTMDAGKNWEPRSINSSASSIKWNDLLWQTATKAILIGVDGMCFYSEDRGTTWQQRVIDEDNKDLKCIMQTDNYQVIGGVNGNFYRYVIEVPEVSMMARYNTKTGEWQTLGSLGLMNYPSAGSGYYISGDGNSIAGIAYNTNATKTTRVAHAAVWSEKEGMMDLGSLFDNTGRATRANSISYDGSVVVGWQDQNGPWHSAVWRKNPAGGYYPNEFLLKDPSKGSADQKNRLSECRSVSLNGKWIGGKGQGTVSATENGWIWSEETGVIELPKLEMGFVENVNNDGTMATGFTGGMQGFIWTKDGGTKTLNEYVYDKFGLDMGDVYLMSALNMSPNGRYLCGWAMEGQIVKGYRLDLQYGSSIESQAMEQCKASVYPNPVSDVLHVDVPFDMDTQIRLLDAQGRTIVSKTTVSQSNSLQLDGVAPGLYILDVAAKGAHKTFKVEVVH